MKYPLEYRLTPRELPEGIRWLTLHLKNEGQEDMKMLDVRLNSLDVYGISTYTPAKYVAELRPDQERLLAFQVSANKTAQVYVSIDGQKDRTIFHWETPPMCIRVGEEVAEFVGLFAMTEPYPPLNERIAYQATIQGLGESEGLDLQFWVETPSGEFAHIDDVETDYLPPGETATYTTEMALTEEGLHTIYAYLYDDVEMLDREIEYVHARAS